MPKEEIIAGLKQAIERGYNLEQAKQSFINAGYSREEVEEAASSFGGVTTQYPQIQQPLQQPTQPPSKLPPQPQQPSQQLPQQKIKKQKKSKKIIFLIIILIFLIILLAVSFIFREKILDFIRNLF